jgi:8-oxo-dGTP pyrophosphatase MutT (NUDIX family)
MEQVTGAGIVFCSQGKVLLLCRPDGSWGIPAGKIEDGETAPQAAIRETLEETGFTTAELTAPMKVVNNSDGCTFYAFHQELEAPFNAVINDEHMACGWFPFELLPAPLFECTGELIAMAQATAVMDRADASARLLDANGWFEIKRNPISKAGVFPYLGKHIPGADPNVMYQVYRPVEELANPETINSAKLLPWIDNHVMLGNGQPRTVPAEQKGVQGVIGQEVFFEGDTLYGNLKLFSGEHGTLINSGKRELSLGFRCRYELAPGVFNGQAYTYVQRQIRGNHIASVDDGRMGPEVAVLDSLSFTFDAKDFQMATPDDKKPGEGEGGEKEMTISELTALVKTLGPQIKAIQDAMAALTTTPAAAAVVEDADKAMTPEAIAADARDKGAAAGKGAADAAIAAAMVSMPLTLAKQFHARDQLVQRLSPHVGVFDASDKTHGDVVAYGLEKLGVKDKAPAGSEAVYLDAYLSALPAPTRVRALGRVAEVTDARDTDPEAAPDWLRAHTGE